MYISAIKRIFKPITKKSSKKKIILVTLRPIISLIEGTRIELYKRYEILPKNDGEK